MAGGRAVAQAAAKLNLYLHVTGRRPDGYHLLDSLVCFAAVHDTVEAEAASDWSLEIGGPFAGPLRAEADNLVLRAGRGLSGLVAAELGTAPPPARLTLQKRLPVAAGIGGGSADAAAVIRALMDLWEIGDLPAARLDALALELGADVPACLAGRAAFVGGIGETLDPAPDLPPADCLLVNPGVPVSTPTVFRARTGDFTPGAQFGGPLRDAAALAQALEGRGNDLTDAAIGLQPVIGEALSLIDSQPGALLARMSGSGATCFGLFADRAACQAAADAIAAAHAGWWVAATELVSDTATLRPALA